MKVLFDHQAFSTQKFGGVSRYYVELMKEFSHLEQPYEIPIYFSNNVYLDEIKEFRNYKDISLFRRIIYKINNVVSNKNLQRRDFDIFHPTYYDPYFLKKLNKPYVLTIYDFMHERFQEMFSSKDKTSVWKKECALKADRIIAISENTKRDIISYYGIDENKIDVVYLASSLQQANRNFSLELPAKYLLFVGSRGRYKNFNLFIKAIASLLKKEKDLYVICAGSNDFTNDELQIFETLGITEQVIHFSIDDEKLAYLYEHAVCFVFPSLYEGFGIPVLEAFNCNCPVVLSDQGSLPEVGGEAVEYFDPYSKKSILEAVENLYYNEDKRRNLRSLGKVQAQKFSWKETAKETIAVYDKLI